MKWGCLSGKRQKMKLGDAKYEKEIEKGEDNRKIRNRVTDLQK